MRKTLDAKKDGKAFTPKKSCKTTVRTKAVAKPYNSSNTISHRVLRNTNVEDF
jgi:hypothetical protein